MQHPSCHPTPLFRDMGHSTAVVLFSAIYRLESKLSIQNGDANRETVHRTVSEEKWNSYGATIFQPLMIPTEHK